MTGSYRKPMKSAYSYGYFQSGTGKARRHRRTLMERLRLWRRRKWKDDLEGLRGWIG